MTNEQRMFDMHSQCYVEGVVPQYVRAPLPARVSDLARQLVDICHAIPAGWWANYGDIAKAHGVLYGTNLAPQAVASSLSFNPKIDPAHPLPSVSERVKGWNVPWHRVRMASGVVRSREWGDHLNPYDVCNVMLRDEGAQFYGAEAPINRQFHIVGWAESQPERRAS